MTTTLDLDRAGASRTVDALVPARLSLTPKTALAGLLDGAWWPRSRDLAAELPALAAALDEPWGRITRVTVNPARWPVVPPTVRVVGRTSAGQAPAGRTLHVGWFVEQDPDKLILLSYTVGRWDLLVVPPETGPAPAARLMAAAAIPGSLLTAGVLMANEAAIGRGTGDVRRREAAWEDEGGACMAPFGDAMGRRSPPVAHEHLEVST